MEKGGMHTSQICSVDLKGDTGDAKALWGLTLTLAKAGPVFIVLCRGGHSFFQSDLRQESLS